MKNQRKTWTFHSNTSQLDFLNLGACFMPSHRKDIPQRRVKRWSFSVRELLKDTAGREHFRRFLEKEFSAENLK